MYEEAMQVMVSCSAEIKRHSLLVVGKYFLNHLLETEKYDQVIITMSDERSTDIQWMLRRKSATSHDIFAAGRTSVPKNLRIASGPMGRTRL